MKQWIIIVLLLVVLVIVLLRRTSGLTSGASTCTACPAKTAGTYYTSINGCATAACSTSAACPATENGTSYLPDGSCVDATQSQPNGFSGAGSCQYSCNPGYVNYAPYTCRLATPTTCPAGQYLSGTTCTNCAANTYKAGTGTSATDCLACPTNSTSVAGSSECACAANYSVVNGACQYNSCTGRNYAA